ncbi:hypothetical protein F0562_022080 [Nyssa sinensis]|uniref:CBM20 domain-containing protein n=1 Tax=Nyssa sinensis TaxID=561372 RepID=A0A5J5BKY1_9ASTE|nr:hypothetical protein F0562_022080 [Nyssa sinensis]
MMEALAGSPTRIFTNDYRDKTLSSSRVPLSKSEITLFRSLNFSVNLSHRISFQHKFQSFAASHHSYKVLTGLETTDTGIQTIQPSKTVHVKFLLQKECWFGEQFLLVGDEPIIGLWNPANAIPLNWSDRHIWTVDLDIPIGKLIQFKYILRKSTGDILWQPGPDRFFRAWETNNLITIAEDWENAEVQKITEESHEKLTIDPEKESAIDGNVTYPGEEFMPVANDDLMSSNDISYLEDKLTVKRNREFITPENPSHPKEGPSEFLMGDVIGYKTGEPVSRNNWRAITDKNPVSVEDEETFVTYEEGHVLIPGMTPLQEASTDEALPKEIGKFIISDASAREDADEDQKVTS